MIIRGIIYNNLHLCLWCPLELCCQQAHTHTDQPSISRQYNSVLLVEGHLLHLLSGDRNRVRVTAGHGEVWKRAGQMHSGSSFGVSVSIWRFPQWKLICCFFPTFLTLFAFVFFFFFSLTASLQYSSTAFHWCAPHCSKTFILGRNRGQEKQFDLHTKEYD